MFRCDVGCQVRKKAIGFDNNIIHIRFVLVVIRIFLCRNSIGCILVFQICGSVLNFVFLNDAVNCGIPLKPDEPHQHLNREEVSYAATIVRAYYHKVLDNLSPWQCLLKKEIAFHKVNCFIKKQKLESIRISHTILLSKP